MNLRIPPCDAVHGVEDRGLAMATIRFVTMGDEPMRAASDAISKKSMTWF